MSSSSVAKCIKAERVTASMLGMLNDIAGSTAMDDSLTSVIRGRPSCVDALAHQALYVAGLASRAKSVALSHNAKSNAVISSASSGLVASPLQIQVAIVGLGGVGSTMVELFLSRGFHPTSIMVLTRQRHQAFAARGVRCFTEVHESLSEADLLIVCCQPGHLSVTAKNFKSLCELKPGAVIFSTCCGVTPEKVAAEFGHPLCVCASIDTERILRVVEDEFETAAKKRKQQRDEGSDGEGEETAAALSPFISSQFASSANRTADLSFPNDAADYFNRSIYCVTLAIMMRGVPFGDSAKAAVEIVSGTKAIAMIVPKGWRGREAQLCTLSSMAEMMGVPQRELIINVRNTFAALCV